MFSDQTVPAENGCYTARKKRGDAVFSSVSSNTDSDDIGDVDTRSPTVLRLHAPPPPPPLPPPPPRVTVQAAPAGLKPDRRELINNLVVSCLYFVAI